MKKIGLLGLLFFIIFLIITLVRSFFNYYKADDRLRKKETEYENLIARREELESKIEEAKKPEFIEKEARDKLNYTKEGEYLVIIPERNITLTPVSSKEVPNWEKWRNLFL